MRTLAATYLMAVVACHALGQFGETVYKRDGEDAARQVDAALIAIGQWLSDRLKE